MDSVQYHEMGLDNNAGSKIAIIDSGNTSIQIPASEFAQLY